MNAFRNGESINVYSVEGYILPPSLVPSEVSQWLGWGSGVLGVFALPFNFALIVSDNGLLWVPRRLWENARS